MTTRHRRQRVMIDDVPRPFLHPALVPVWRDPCTVQFGLSADRAVVIGGVAPAIAAVIEQLDGFHSGAGLKEIAQASGADRRVVEAALTLLRDHGVMVDADESGLPGRDPTAALEITDGQRAPDRVSAALVHGGDDTGRSVMTARAASHVEVIGGGRVGATVARLLAAAGIGMVSCHDTAVTRPSDVIPGGLDRSAVGTRRDIAVAGALARERTEPASVALDDGTSAGPCFVVVAPDTGTGRAEATDLVRAGTAHLLVRIEETTGVVGPLVVPGRTSCVRCHDLHRTDRDPGWPTVLHHADLARAPIPARDAALVTLVAGLATTQVLNHLDGHDVAAVDGTIETTLPHGLPRRRSWQAHPACGCAWSLEGAVSPE